MQDPITPVDPLCARCARVQKTCCQSRDIYLTPGDLRRIEAATSRTDFWSHRRSEDPDVLDQDDDPEWYRTFRDDGSRRVLKRSANGDCSFLGSTGCTLGSEVRPLICRLYPFDYTAAGLKTEMNPLCPKQLLAPEEQLLRALAMSAAGVEPLRRQLYEEIREEPNPPITCNERSTPSA